MHKFDAYLVIPLTTTNARVSLCVVGSAAQNRRKINYFLIRQRICIIICCHRGGSARLGSLKGPFRASGTWSWPGNYRNFLQIPVMTLSESTHKKQYGYIDLALDARLTSSVSSYLLLAKQLFASKNQKKTSRRLVIMMARRATLDITVFVDIIRCSSFGRRWLPGSDRENAHMKTYDFLCGCCYSDERL